MDLAMAVQLLIKARQKNEDRQTNPILPACITSMKGVEMLADYYG